MNASHTVKLRQSDLAPIFDWLGDVRRRVESWSGGVRSASAEEWNRLRATVTRTLSLPRVEGALKEFLARLGVRAEDSLAEELTLELRLRVVAYRQGETIEDYPEHLVTPPSIRL